MTPAQDPASSRVGMNLVLYVVALVTAAACVIVGVAVVRALQDDETGPVGASVQMEELDESSAEEQERFGDIIEAATAQIEAFINIRYDDAETAIAKVKAGATGDFLEQYTKSTDGLLDLLEQGKSVRTGEVVWAGVVSADQDSATVIVATTGAVAHTKSDNKPVAETYRLQLELVKKDDAWLTSDLQFVT